MSNRRKTLLAGEIAPFDPDIVDDEAERRLRRQSGRFGPSGSRNVNREDPGNTPRLAIQPQLPKPSNEQLSFLYNNCVKLLNENKINAKNAFQLKLIDYMSDIVLNKEIVGGTTNFQVVGCTIDVGTKIYAARVDALHQNTYQMLSGLAQGGGEDSGEARDEGDENGGDVGAGGDDNMLDDTMHNKKAAKAKKKRVKKSAQIVENLDTINVKARDEFTDEDNYFYNISTCIETQAIAGILLNKLQIKNDSGCLMINKDDKTEIGVSDEEHVKTEPVDLKEVIDTYRVAHRAGCDVRDWKLCSDLGSFRFIGWNQDSKEDDISHIMDNMVSQQDEEKHRWDVNERNETLLNRNSDLDIDVDNDHDDHDIGGDNYVGGGEVSVSHHGEIGVLDKIDDLKSMHSIADLTTLISHSPSDYSYFNFDKIKLADLPRHLKRIAQLAKAMPGGENNQDTVIPKLATATAKNKKEMPYIEFDFNLEVNKAYKMTKKAVYLCDKTIEKRSEKPIRMETERQYDFNGKDLFQPFHKKITAKILSEFESIDNLLVENENEKGGLHLPVVRGGGDRSALNLNDVDDDDDDRMNGIGDDFHIPCTAQTSEPFFTQGTNQMDMDQNHSMLDGAENMEPMMNMNVSRFDGDNLIQAPMQVNALNIDYAKHSKNIDVRRLKQVIWSLLCDDQDKENTNETYMNNTTDEDGGNINKTVKAANVVNSSLKAIYMKLRPPLISQRVYEDLSVCIVFQILLFLANEHGLQLRNDPIGSDVVITNA